MAGKCLWIALFVTLQISFALCRSTGQPDEAVKEFTVLPTGEVPKAEALKDNAAPGTMLYDNKVDIDDDALMREYLEQKTMTAAEIVGIVIGVSIFLSLIVGCILIFVCKKSPRRGHIVNRNTGGQTGVMQQMETTVPGVPGSHLPMQQYPPANQQVQNQNIYPAVHQSI